MNKGNLILLSLLLVGGVTAAAVYKWVDESGRVHYGDRPPAEGDAQSVTVPEGPSPEQIERARQELQKTIERAGKSSKKPAIPEPSSETPREADSLALRPADVACFHPLSDIVTAPSAQTFSPIAPTPLSASEQATLRTLFERIEARWDGSITDLKCLGNASNPDSRVTHFEVAMTADWDAHQSRLTVQTDIRGKENRATERLEQRFEVGDALYYSDYKSAGVVAQEGNKVELLSLSPHHVTFLIKRRISTGSGNSLLRAEVRQLEFSGSRLKLTELNYLQAELAGSRTWVLNR